MNQQPIPKGKFKSSYTIKYYINKYYQNIISTPNNVEKNDILVIIIFSLLNIKICTVPWKPRPRKSSVPTNKKYVSIY
jgi:hypothetical protein